MFDVALIWIAMPVVVFGAAWAFAPLPAWLSADVHCAGRRVGCAGARR
ncbi:hypothetical protein BDSB_01705 [Burkholderia dolosa PC543]|nr:hypothetical protein BDSB_01705 [Burkholderia dolosa PC543]